MKKLHRLIIGSFIGPFILTFFITLFILVMQFLWKYVDDLVGKGLEWNIIAELMLYASANLVPMALPLAILLSSIMTYGNLAEKYELVALKSAGVSLQRAMFPIFMVVLLLSYSAFYFSNNIWPVANLKFASLLHDITHKKPAIDIKEGIFYKEIDNYVIRVEEKDKDSEVLHDIMIYDHTEKDGNRTVIRAEEGTMSMSRDESKLILSLKNGYSYDEQSGRTAPLYRNEFEKETIYIDVTGFKMTRSDEDLFKNNYKMLNISQLEKAIDTLYMERDDGLKKYQDRVLDNLYPFRDTLHKAMAPVDSNAVFPVDSLSRAKQISVYQTGMNLTRRSKTYINTLARHAQSVTYLIRRHKIEWHRKFTLSVACIVLFFIGAPLGAIIRKGGLGMPVIISILFFLVFHVLSITGEKIVKQGNMEAANGMWMATVILFPIGAFLTFKATTDSNLLDREWYDRLMERLKERFKKAKS